ncbi:hypothetical protein DXG03_009425 [Asterophora parasitica]|uniref:NodB homology domain-containing protein n=1 Tax=Asterophora parasitica TaxID=117018 RepID=A0A9P7KFG9_9AGAR|nr:hypothetical protein DXG03_009425 [Asterophora parasitica]
MRSQTFAALVALLGASNVHAHNPRHVEIIHKRQATSTTAHPPAGGVTIIPNAPTGTGVPPLESLTFGMPSKATIPVTATFAAGATPPVSGAPGLPTPFVFKLGDWPAQDKVAPPDSDEVREWLKELDGVVIPDIKPTADGSNLLNYLTEKKILATFFVVGSRVIERPNVLLEEYMAGHEISVHTWSHRPLTSLTTEQVVAELGWTRHAIRTILGVTPTTMRPPFGDIDDRVRAIAMAMGLTPIMWTRTPDGGQFDTNDWRVAGGLVSGQDSFGTFQRILTNATAIDSGFIVLQHDLYELTVDLAIGYTLNAALNHNPSFKLLPIGQCSKIPTSNLYFESNQNHTFPNLTNANGGYDISGDGKIDFGPGKKSSSAGLTNAIGHRRPEVSVSKDKLIRNSKLLHSTAAVRACCGAVSSMSSLITIVRNKFLEAIRSVNPPGKWKILVVDDFTQKLLGTVLKQFDILQENVTLIESINNNREIQSGFEAMYLLMPTSQNVNRIIQDFAGTVKQYGGAHLFFIEGLEEHLFEKLTSSPAEPFLRGLREVFLNFTATEAQAFSLQDPALFFSLYSPPKGDSAFKSARVRVQEDLKFVSKIITNVCITLNEFPFIRYYVPPHHPPLGPLKPHAENRPPPPPEASSRWRTNLARGAEARAYESVEGDYLTKLLAFMVQHNLEEHKKQNPDFSKYQPGTPEASRPRATLFITDRSMDMVAPFLHEFTYQAMANDLLPIQDGTKYTYKFQSSVGSFEDKTAILTDTDSVWTDVRHLHMREAIDKLMLDFNKFLQENAVFKGEGAASLNDMKEMLASLPQYQEQREKFSLHLNMAQECMGIFEKDKLAAIANVEQNCATGLTAEAKTPKNLVEEMVPLLDSRDVLNINKVRIVALYIQHRDGVPEEDRRRLYQHARLTLAEQDAVNALNFLGVRINRTAADRDTKKKIKQKTSNDEEYELSRFKPLLRTVLEEHVAGKLDNSLFPYAKEAPSAAPLPSSLRSPPPQATSLRSQKPSWHRAPRQGATQTETRARLLVFIAGGATYSELREGYQLSSALNMDVYIGSTHTITPRHFIDDLKALDLGGVGSRALPNGLQDRPAHASFQEYYDEKYYTKDAPPRAPPASLPVPRDRHAPKISPTNSFASSVHSTAPTPSVKEEKKKKKGGLFRF